MNKLLCNFKFSSASASLGVRPGKKFYQRIFPSAKKFIDEHNMTELPANLKFITKQDVSKFYKELLTKAKTVEVSIKGKATTEPTANFEKTHETNKNVVHIQGSMSTTCNAGNLIEDLKLSKPIDSKSTEKIENFITKALLRSLNISKIEVNSSLIEVKYFRDVPSATGRVGNSKLLIVYIGALTKEIGEVNDHITVVQTSKISLSYSCELLQEDIAAQVLHNLFEIVENPLKINL